MDLIIAFLSSLVASDLAHSAAVALVVGPLVVRLVNMADAEFGLSGKSFFKLPLKYVVSILFSFIVPTSTYALLQFLTKSPYTVDGFIVAASVGWFVAQTFHQATKAQTPAPQAPEQAS